MNRSTSPRFEASDPFKTGRLDFTAAHLRFGKRSFAPGDIVAYRIGSGERSGFFGNLCAVVVFVCLAALILSAIVGEILPHRTLIGVATLAMVGLASCQDAWFERGSGFYELFVRLRTAPGLPVTQEIMVFASSERNEIVTVAQRLEQAVPGLAN